MALPDFIDATVATRPQRTFTVSAVDYKSVWNTCHNPLIYNIQLFGDVVDYIDNSVTGGVDCYIHSATIAATYTVGDKLFLYGTTYNGYYTVVAISGHYVTIDAIYIGDDLNEQYITNLRIKANLKIEIEVWAKEIDSDPFTPTLIAVSRYTPSAIKTGSYNQLQVKADISQFIQGVLKSCKDEIA
jgi:hypothetical protein